jgi:hypothetical protein
MTNNVRPAGETINMALTYRYGGRTATWQLIEVTATVSFRPPLDRLRENLRVGGVKSEEVAIIRANLGHLRPFWRWGHD